ncbi:MAG: DegT/DnrJ/EryC1/StrS aminotransferase family protein [Spirochaetales bacterium]|nr:DegT/DnrJ/EryC1/StrS aminotransferase family protein [Spirochaetales bacterium]
MARHLYQTEKKNAPIEAARPTLSRQDLESVLDCLIHDNLNTGMVAGRLEKQVAQAMNFKQVTALNSLSAAYHMALLGLGIGPGDAVLLSVIAPVQAADAIRYCKATPVLVDIDQNSFHPAASAILEKSTAYERETGRPPAACIIDHTFGSPATAAVDALLARKIPVLEDITGLFGTELNDAYAGSRSLVAVCGMSEFDLITTGNGGLVITTDPAIHKKIQELRYGSARQPGSLAYDYRLEDFQAAIGLVQLSRLGITLARRRKIGLRYLETIRQTDHETYFQNPGIDSFLRFPVLIHKNYEEIKRYFASLHIGIDRAIAEPLHRLLDLPRMEYPNGERLFRKAIAIPLYPGLTAANVERIAASLRGLI